MICIAKEKEKIMFNFQLPPNKPLNQQHWNLKISICTGFLVNIDETGASDQSLWINCNDDVQYTNHLNNTKLAHDGIEVQITLNDNILDQLDLTNILEKTFVHDIDTDSNRIDCNLKLTVSGFEDRHMLLLANDMGARPAIKITNIKFEDVDITKIFNDRSIFIFNQTQSIGDTLLSCNGISSFDFYTPIYSWLLKNKNLISN